MSEEKKVYNIRKILINFGIEIVIYGVLLTAYYFLVLRFLAAPLFVLFEDYIVVYAVVSLLLILAQGVLLERLTHYLLNRIGLEKFE